MKFAYSILTCLFVVVLASSSFAQKKKQLPSSLEVKTLSGKTVSLKKYVAKKGKITVLSFWATWCKPCKAELDNIAEEYYEKWQDDYDVELIAISMDAARTTKKVRPMVDAKGWDYDVLCDPNNNAYQALGFNAVPYTILLDEKGNIIDTHTGYKPGDEDELEEKISKLAK